MKLDDIYNRNHQAQEVRKQYDSGEEEWNSSKMVEIILAKPDDFLKIKETLTRMGVASRGEKKLYQSTHILHKQGKYYIVHFKELFALDGKQTNITLEDVQRRNEIIKLLAEWNLLTVKRESIHKLEPAGNLSMFKIISFKEKTNWILCPKYNIGTVNYNK